jgi:hypothetical protein
MINTKTREPSQKTALNRVLRPGLGLGIFMGIV